MTKEQPNNWEEQISEWFNFKPSSLGGELSMGRFEKQEVINFIKEVISQEREKMIEEIKKHAYYEYRPEVKGVWYLQANKKIIGLDTLLDLLQNK